MIKSVIPCVEPRGYGREGLV